MVGLWNMFKLTNTGYLVVGPWNMFNFKLTKYRLVSSESLEHILIDTVTIYQISIKKYIKLFDLYNFLPFQGF